jgi:hypothetical protein
VAFQRGKQLAIVVFRGYLDSAFVGCSFLLVLCSFLRLSSVLFSSLLARTSITKPAVFPHSIDPRNLLLSLSIAPAFCNHLFRSPAALYSENFTFIKSPQSICAVIEKKRIKSRFVDQEEVSTVFCDYAPRLFFVSPKNKNTDKISCNDLHNGLDFEEKLEKNLRNSRSNEN